MVRKLGRSAHPYLLVSYFSFIATLAGLVGTFTFEKPAIPDNWREWGVWLVIGLSGFVFFFSIVVFAVSHLSSLSW
jgi:drug/metabolite transporter (DMT)-like permease